MSDIAKVLAINEEIMYNHCGYHNGYLGGIHKLREQGRGRGVVLKMFIFVHKGEERGSANVHVALNCKYFKYR